MAREWWTGHGPDMNSDHIRSDWNRNNWWESSDLHSNKENPSALDRSFAAWAFGTVTDSTLDNMVPEKKAGQKPIYIVFSGANEMGDNPTLIDNFVKPFNSKYYTTAAAVSSVGVIKKALDYTVSQVTSSGNNYRLYIIGYSAGGDAAIRLAATLNEKDIMVSGLVIFDPHGSMRPLGSKNYNLPNNVMAAINILQDNSQLFHKFYNPFDGGRITRCSMNCIQIDLTGIPKITHNNIVTEGIKRYDKQIKKILGF